MSIRLSYGWWWKRWITRWILNCCAWSFRLWPCWRCIVRTSRHCWPRGFLTPSLSWCCLRMSGTFFFFCICSPVHHFFAIFFFFSFPRLLSLFLQFFLHFPPVNHLVCEFVCAISRLLSLFLVVFFFVFSHFITFFCSFWRIFSL